MGQLAVVKEEVVAKEEAIKHACDDKAASRKEAQHVQGKLIELREILDEQVCAHNARVLVHTYTNTHEHTHAHTDRYPVNVHTQTQTHVYARTHIRVGQGSKNGAGRP